MFLLVLCVFVFLLVLCVFFEYRDEVDAARTYRQRVCPSLGHLSREENNWVSFVDLFPHRYNLFCTKVLARNMPTSEFPE